MCGFGGGLCRSFQDLSRHEGVHLRRVTVYQVNVIYVLVENNAEGDGDQPHESGNYCGFCLPDPHRFRLGRNMKADRGVESFLVEQKEGVRCTWRRLVVGKPGLGFL